MADDTPAQGLEERLSSMNTWAGAPSAKERGAVQRAVTELLDTLAPEQMLTRRERAEQRVEQYRTPSACILQGSNAAVSVTWFADAAVDGTFGELHILVWSGVLSRRGGPPARGGARLVSELVFKPVLAAESRCMWEDADGKQHETAAVAARCIALLEEQLGA
jgi:hypothetical protein